jgi:hypothetical protein
VTVAMDDRVDAFLGPHHKLLGRFHGDDSFDWQLVHRLEEQVLDTGEFPHARHHRVDDLVEILADARERRPKLGVDVLHIFFLQQRKYYQNVNDFLSYY